MKNFTTLIEGALTDLVTTGDPSTDDAVEPTSPEVAADDPKVIVYIQQGYRIRAVVKDDDGNEIVQLIKGDPDTGEDVKFVTLESMHEDEPVPDPSVQRKIDKEGRMVDSWINSCMKAHHQISVKKKFRAPEPLNDNITYWRWELSWNRKPFLIVTVSPCDILDDWEPCVNVGVDARGVVRGSRLPTLLQKQNKRGYQFYDAFRSAIELAMDYLPDSEIPEEYR